MKRHILSAIAVAAAFCANGAADDPVLLTVDGRDVRVSEFEYLYNKNNGQQLRQGSLDEYLGMFINYKLKVADALSAGLDSTAKFRNEFESFRVELAKPYMRDTIVERELIEKAYSHYLDDVLASHIMLPPTAEGKATLDSLQPLLAAGKADFATEARRISIDKPTAERGGHLGYVVPGRFPAAFEDAAYSTAPGTFSPVFSSGMGYHIVYVEQHTPSAGEVNADHILLMTRGKSPREAAACGELADSLYALLSAGAPFADIAKEYSQDPGSAAQGGKLGWFRHGTMVAEFDSAAFATPAGSVSRPFATSFGYHILRCNERRAIPPLADLKADISMAIASDERSLMPEQAYMERLLKRINAAVHTDAVAALAAKMAGGDARAEVLTAYTTPLATSDAGNISAQDIAGIMEAAPAADAATIEMAVRAALESKASEYERARLYNTVADYRNLLNEYHDGILLCEISEQKVWKKSTDDKKGLETFFKANADKYTWESPRFKSYIFFAASDSLLGLAVEYADTLPTGSPEEFAAAMRKRFGRDIKIERVVAGKGDNPITDYLAFGGKRPAPRPDSRWNCYVAYRGRMLDAPEEAADVRGAAVSDYQTKLEHDWLRELHRKYKVKVNKKVFNKLK